MAMVTDSERRETPSRPDATSSDKLVLASEALAEDLAPQQPSIRSGRAALFGVALALASLGVALRFGLGLAGSDPDPSSVSFAMAGATALVALLPFPYAMRASVALALAVFMMALGCQGVGPLGGMTADGGIARDLTRLVTLSVLPAALLFRAKYRAYRPARFVLAVALLTALPLVGTEAFLATDGSAPGITRAAAVLDIVVVLCGLFGFMPKDTTGAASVWAVMVLGILSASIALRELTPLATPEIGRLVYATTAVGTCCAATLASLGIYQLLAAVLAADARRVSMKKEPQSAETSPA